MSVRLSCPSCNTAFVLAAVPADRRAACPRCADVFPVRGEVTEHATGTPTAPPVAKSEVPKGGWSAGRIAGVAIVLGLIGVAVGLFFSNREPKPKDEPQGPPATTTAAPPARLSGLGYLPAECNVVFVVQPGPVLEYAARTNQEPRELLTRTGLPVPIFGALDSIGLPLAQIDHVAGGLFLPSGPEELRVALVLVLKQPLGDEDEFLKKLKAKPMPEGKSRFTIELGKVPIAPTLARVSPTVWMFGLSTGDFAAVEKGGFGPGGTQFRGGESGGFRKMLATVPPTAAVWIAADDDLGWAQKPAVKLFGQSPEVKKWLPALNDFRGGMFALSFGEQPRMQLLVRTADAGTADRVRAYFQARAAEAPNAQAQKGGEAYAHLDAPFDPALLQRILADAIR